jgi:DNA polymerase kappa
MQPEIDRLMKKRKRFSTCVVVDMDAFYMSCELLSRPDLNDKPAVVGGGMILTSNYVARKYGVRSAMAGWIADKLVEELSNGKEKLVHVPSNFDLYTKKAHEVRSVLGEYDPKMRAYSLDEAYLDLEPYLSLRLGRGLKHEEVVAALSAAEQSTIDEEEDGEDKPPAENEDASLDHLSPDAALKATATIVDEMRQKVFEATGGLTCSAGLASNFMLSKIASDLNKPNGQCIVGPTNKEILNFLRPMKVRKIGGIGRVTEKILNAFGIKTVQELYDHRALVQFIFAKQATANFLLQRSVGWSNSDSNSKDEEEESLGQKGISKERTFRAGRTWGEVNSKLEEIAVALSGAMLRKNLFAHTITLKVKLATFDVLSRAKSMARGVYIQSSQEMIPIVSKILSDLKKEHKGAFNVRLLGIRCSNFKEESDSRQKQLDAYLVKNPTAPETVSLPKRSDVHDEDKTNQTREQNLALSPYRQKTVGASSPPVRRHVSSPRPSSATAAVSLPDDEAVCPICSKAIPGDNDNLNRHVDACLNAGTVAKLVGESNKEAEDLAKSKKRRVLKDFFA